MVGHEAALSRFTRVHSADAENREEVQVAVHGLEPERFAYVVATRVKEDRDPISSLCLACTDVLGVTGAGLMLISGNKSLSCIGVSDDIARAVEDVEYTLGEGPCIAAFNDKIPVFEPDLNAGGGRWPEFRKGALAVGVGAAFGFPLLVDQVCIGALNLYQDRAGPLTAQQVDDALVAADIASRTLLTWQAVAPPGMIAWQLEAVPNNRVEVHQAAGRISVQAGVPVDDAIVLLRAYAFSQDRLISDVARDVAEGHLRFD